MTEQELREMKLHEKRVIKSLITDIVEVCRVADGWVYLYYGNPVRIFVPEFRPSRWYSVVLSKDGDKWCCLFGRNLQEGLAGFGSTPEEACKDFDERWHKK